MCTATVPPLPSCDTTSPEAPWCAAQDRLGTAGRPAPPADTVTLPAACPGIVCAVSATAPAPDAGTPACPATGTVPVWPGPTWTRATPPPISEPKVPAAAGIPDSQYPSASTVTVTTAAEELRTVTAPPRPSAVTTSPAGEIWAGLEKPGTFG